MKSFSFWKSSDAASSSGDRKGGTKPVKDEARRRAEDEARRRAEYEAMTPREKALDTMKEWNDMAAKQQERVDSNLQKVHTILALIANDAAEKSVENLRIWMDNFKNYLNLENLNYKIKGVQHPNVEIVDIFSTLNVSKEEELNKSYPNKQAFKALAEVLSKQTSFQSIGRSLIQTNKLSKHWQKSQKICCKIIKIG